MDQIKPDPHEMGQVRVDLHNSFDVIHETKATQKKKKNTSIRNCPSTSFPSCFPNGYLFPFLAPLQTANLSDHFLKSRDQTKERIKLRNYKGYSADCDAGTGARSPGPFRKINQTNVKITIQKK